MTPDEHAELIDRFLAQHARQKREHVESAAKREKWDDLLAVEAETRRRWEDRYGTEEVAAVEGYERDDDPLGYDGADERERDLTGQQ